MLTWEEVYDIPWRLALANRLRKPIPHGTTCGKLYTLRPDCDECVLEAWERMKFGGCHVSRAN